MTHEAIIILISSLVVLLGVVLLFIRGDLRKQLVLKKDLENKTENISALKDNIKEIIFMDPHSTPDLLRVNGGFAGKQMSGEFARKGAPVSYYASYNCFHFLFCPIFPLGCYLINESYGGVRSYGELKTEKDELLYVLTKGWGIMLILAGILVALIGLS